MTVSPCWRISGGVLSLADPLFMGILNVTPDSFSDGGELRGVDDALRRAESMARAGAGILDVGGESTRPGADPVDADEEARRVVPVVEALARELPLPISVDTRKSRVARLALEAGAAVVNDVSGLAFDPRMAEVVAGAGAGIVLMHMRGAPADMREHARYDDLLGEVRAELLRSVRRAREAGIPDEAMVLDPGIGFAKNAAQSLALLAGLEALAELGFPVLVGPSRKSFLGKLLRIPPGERVTGSAVACALAWERGARIFRVHDVTETAQALAVARAVAEAAGESSRGADPRGGRGVHHGSARPGPRRGEDNSR